MAIRILHPLFRLMASLTRQELARQVAYLKVENQFCGRGCRNTSSPRRRNAETCSGPVASWESVARADHHRHLRNVSPLGAGKRRGEPRGQAQETSRPSADRRRVRAIILKLARENSWGYTRILGELKKLGITTVSRTTVKNILIEHGLEPGPQRGVGDLGRVSGSPCRDAVAMRFSRDEGRDRHRPERPVSAGLPARRVAADVRLASDISPGRGVGQPAGP